MKSNTDKTKSLMEAANKVTNAMPISETMGVGAMGASPSSSPSMNRGGMGAGMGMGKTPMNYGTQRSGQPDMDPLWRRFNKDERDRKWRLYRNPWYDENKVRPDPINPDGSINPDYLDDEDVWPLDPDTPSFQSVKDFYDNLDDDGGVPDDYFQVVDGQTVVNPKYNAAFLDTDKGLQWRYSPEP